MTPKEKAKELVYKMRDDLWEKRCVKIHLEDAQLCAITALDEIIEAIEWHEYETPNKEIRYWQEVKQEIENL